MINTLERRKWKPYYSLRNICLERSFDMKDLCSILSVCNTEEEVKHEFAKYFKYKLDTKERIDLYTESILFEFKYDVNMKSV